MHSYDLRLHVCFCSLPCTHAFINSHLRNCNAAAICLMQTYAQMHYILDPNFQAASFKKICSKNSRYSITLT
eukprot:c39099_g1_i1 orf=1-213(-)